MQNSDVVPSELALKQSCQSFKHSTSLKDCYNWCNIHFKLHFLLT